MSEMRNYSKPPQAVHDVLIAALLLLGDSEDTLKVCQSCPPSWRTVKEGGFLSEGGLPIKKLIRVENLKQAGF